MVGLSTVRESVCEQEVILEKQLLVLVLVFLKLEKIHPCQQISVSLLARLCKRKETWFQGKDNKDGSGICVILLRCDQDKDVCIFKIHDYIQHTYTTTASPQSTLGTNLAPSKISYCFYEIPLVFSTQPSPQATRAQALALQLRLASRSLSSGFSFLGVGITSLPCHIQVTDLLPLRKRIMYCLEFCRTVPMIVGWLLSHTITHNSYYCVC